MTAIKSPFFVVHNFISPKLCESILDSLRLDFPDFDEKGKPLKTLKFHQKSEDIILDKFEQVQSTVMQYYNASYYGCYGVSFELYATDYQAKPATCDNSNLIKNKWTRTKDYDFTAVIFFSEYCESDIEDFYEVYGGHYEFPTHTFGFKPTRGSLLIYPSGPNFINGISDVITGNLVIGKFFIKAQIPYKYDPSQFPGNYKLWFNS